MLSDIHRRIVNAKYVYERAVSIQAESNEMSLSIALLLTHDAIELLMLAVLDHVGAKPNARRNFMDFWTDMKQATSQEPPDIIPMESLNKLRVGLKHNGNVPNPQTVRELMPRAKGFFENVLGAFCGLRYDEVSLIDSIDDAEVRDLIKEARAKFESNDKPEAMKNLKIALHKIEHPKNKYLPRIEAPEAPSIPSLQYELSDIQRGIERYTKSLHDFLALTAARINAIGFGFDPVRYAAFARHGPSVAMYMDGTFHISHRRNYDNVTPAVFNELVNFLVDYALKLSEAYEPITHRRFL